MQTASASSNFDENNDIPTPCKSDSGECWSATKRKRREEKDDAVLQTALKVMSERNDKWDVFGEYVASELRNLHEENIQIAQTAKCEILRVLLNSQQPSAPRFTTVQSGGMYSSVDSGVQPFVQLLYSDNHINQ